MNITHESVHQSSGQQDPQYQKEQIQVLDKRISIHHRVCISNVYNKKTTKLKQLAKRSDSGPIRSQAEAPVTSRFDPSTI